MITPDQIEEWLREIEERPPSAALIIRAIARRLRELSERNEELLAENLALRSGQKAEEAVRRGEGKSLGRIQQRDRRAGDQGVWLIAYRRCDCLLAWATFASMYARSNELIRV